MYIIHHVFDLKNSITTWLGFLQWNLDLTKCLGTGPIGSLNRKPRYNEFLGKQPNCSLYRGIILKLYSPRYPVNITFQGAAAQLSHIFRVLFITFHVVILYFLTFTTENYTKTIIIRLGLSKYKRIFTSPTVRQIFANIYFAFGK